MSRFAHAAKYIVSGGTAACVNLGLLYILTEYGGFYYLRSAVASFTAALVVSFLLQKFWTFGDRRTDALYGQMFWYLLVSLCNLLLNTLFLYILVEHFHLWYLGAEVLVGGTLAIATYFVYRFLFNVQTAAALLSVWLVPAAAAAILVVVGGLATYKLTESPPTWLDEGIITQVALNTSRGAAHASLQTAPETLVSAGYVTTSYPVTYPIAASLSLFGEGLLQARVVMALFILAFVCAAYALARRQMSVPQALLALLLVASFAPLYGNGKNVLGEVPGLFFITAFLYTVARIEAGERRAAFFALAGVLLGLAVVTKPLFLLLLLPVAVALLFSRDMLSVRTLIAAAVGFALPALVWLKLQFNGESLSYILSVYANPHGNELGSSLLSNMLGFVTHLEPLYALGLLAAWLLSITLRVWRGGHVSRVEYIAAGFALLVYLACLRTESYYRYFFAGEVLALLYLPRALFELRPRFIPRAMLYAGLVALVALQFYQVFFDSWVAAHYDSRRTEQLSALAAAAHGTVFVYQAPEAVIFLPTDRYYQYLKVTNSIALGSEHLPLLQSGVLDTVIIPQELASSTPLEHYRLERVFDRYTLWYKKD